MACFDNVVFSVQEFFKVVPGIVIFPLSFILAWKKFRTSVSCLVKINSNNFLPTQFSSVVLSNNKDRPVTIFEVVAVIDDRYQVSVEKFDPPLVLKALETLSVVTTPYSALYTHEGEWEPEILAGTKLTLYVVVPKGIHKCKDLSRPHTINARAFRNYITPLKETYVHSGKTASNKVKFLLYYMDGNQRRLSFISYAGMLDESKGLPFNAIAPAYLVDVDCLAKHLRAGLTFPTQASGDQVQT